MLRILCISAFALFAGWVGPPPPAGAGEPADEPADGIYYLAPDGAGTTVEVQGATLTFGGRYPHAIRAAALTSRDNANREYDLRLTTDFEGDEHARTEKILVVGDRAWRSQGAGSSGGTESYLTFRIGGGEPLAPVERHFGVQAIHRRHPGYALFVEFVVPDEPFVAGQPMEVELRIQNVGRERIAFVRGGQNRGARDSQFTFVAIGGPGHRVLQDVGDPINFGGSAYLVRLAPGEVHTQQVDLAKWFQPEPGTYQVLGAYALSFHDPAKEGWGPVLWEDHATASFVLSVSAHADHAAEGGG